MKTLAFVLALLFISSASAGAADLPLFTPPSGWSATSGDSLMGMLQSVWQGPLPFATQEFKMDGMWAGSDPMQMLTLAQGKAVAPPQEIARLFPDRDVSHGSNVQYHVATQRHNFCGMPGTIVNVRFGGLMGFVMAYDLAVTQSNGVSYMASYIHMAGQTDPSAEQALLSLCPAGENARRQSSTQ